MKKILKIFILLAVVCGVFTAYQFLGRATYRTNKVIMRPMKLERVEKRGLPHPPPPTAAEVQATKDKEQKEKDELAVALRKEKREDLKLYLGFGTTIFSSFVSIILAIINRKKD